MKYMVILEKGRESGFVAHVLSLRGCVFQGESREEAVSNIKEAIEAYVEALVEDGLPVPTDNPPPDRLEETIKETVHLT